MYEAYIETNIAKNCGHGKSSEHMNIAAALIGGRRGYIEIAWII